jgi:hypothetical protein
MTTKNSPHAGPVVDDATIDAVLAAREKREILAKIASRPELIQPGEEGLYAYGITTPRDLRGELAAMRTELSQASAPAPASAGDTLNDGGVLRFVVGDRRREFTRKLTDEEAASVFPIQDALRLRSFERPAIAATALATAAANRLADREQDVSEAHKRRDEAEDLLSVARSSAEAEAKKVEAFLGSFDDEEAEKKLRWALASIVAPDPKNENQTRAFTNEDIGNPNPARGAGVRRVVGVSA